MKYLKTYEEVNERELQIGDYIFCDGSFGFSEEVANFIENNIGQYVANDSNDRDILIIQYENVPNELRKNLYYTDENYTTYENAAIMERWEIKYWSPNKEDLEIYLDSNKYNL